MALLVSTGEAVQLGYDLDEMSLAAASDAVIDAAGSRIVATTSVVRMPGQQSQRLRPVPSPITSVTSATINGKAVTDYVTYPEYLFRACGWGDPSTPVEVTVRHGAAELPADIQKLVLSLATLVQSETTGGGARDPRVRSESVDDYQVVFDPNSGLTTVELPKRTRAALRARFSGDVSVSMGAP